MENTTLKNYVNIERDILLNNIAGLLVTHGSNQIDRITHYIDFAYMLGIISYDEMNALRKRAYKLAFKEKTNNYHYVKRMLFNTIEYIEY